MTSRLGHPGTLATLEARARLYRILDELEIDGTVRAEMGLEPELALAIVTEARKRKRVRNMAGYVVTRWRKRPRGLEPGPLLEPGPPSLEALEYVWSAPHTATREALLAMLAAAIGLGGGFARMRPPQAS